MDLRRQQLVKQGRLLQGVGFQRVHHLQVFGGHAYIPFPGKVGRFLHFQGTCIKDEQANNYSNEQAQETSGISHANYGLFNEASNSRTWTRVEVQYELRLRFGELQ